MITAKIDMTKIDQSRLFPGKAGANYLDVVLIETPNSKYDDDYMVVQGVSQEERARGVKGPILGNAKIIQSRGRAGGGQRSLPPLPQGDMDVPF